MARDLAVAVGDPAVALQSVDETDRAFRIDSYTMRQETLAALAKTAINPIQSRALADAAWTALDEALAADNFDVAKLLATQGVAAAKRGKDIDMQRQWTARAKDIEELTAEFDAVRPALTTIVQKPLDPTANAAVGHYRIFVKGDWDTGLPMIALGTESPLQALAIVEMSPPAEAEGATQTGRRLVGPGRKLRRRCRERSPSRPGIVLVRPIAAESEWLAQGESREAAARCHRESFFTSASGRARQ